MKKLTLLASMLLIFALIMGACSTADDDDRLDNVTTPEAFATDLGDPMLETPVVTEDPGLVSPTAEVTLEPTLAVTATTDTGAMATPVATLDSTGTLTGTTGLLDDDDPSRATAILDYDVLTYDGDDVGEVADLIVNMQTEQIDYVIVSVGGFLGLGERNVAVPFDQVTIPATGMIEGSGLKNNNGNANTNASNDNSSADMMFDRERVVYVNLNEETLKNAPEIDLDDLDFTLVDWDVEFRTFWANPTSGAATNDNGNMATATPAAGDNTNANTNTNDNTNIQAGTVTTGVTPVAIRMTVLLDSHVVDVAARSAASTGVDNTNTVTNTVGVTADVDELGEVEEVILDPKTGRVLYAVIEADDDMELGDVWVPVPLAHLELAYAVETIGADSYVLYIERDLVLGAPNFDAGSLPAYDDGWDVGLRDYWDIQ